jgi:hypothetical protein
MVCRFLFFFLSSYFHAQMNAQQTFENDVQSHQQFP